MPQWELWLKARQYSMLPALTMSRGFGKAINCPTGLSATVLNADVEKIALMTNGNVTSGGLVIHTKSTLYYQDAMSFEYVSEMSNSPGIKALAFGTPTRGQNTPECKQSFIRYKGRIFRIMGEGFQNANFFTYVAVHYIAYGSDGANVIDDH